MSAASATPDRAIDALAVADWRFECVIEDAPPQRLEVPTGTDGVVPFDRIGFVDVPGVGTLDVWRLAS